MQVKGDRREDTIEDTPIDTIKSTKSISRSLRRWLVLAGIVVVAAVIAGTVLALSQESSGIGSATDANIEPSQGPTVRPNADPTPRPTEPPADLPENPTASDSNPPTQSPTVTGRPSVSPTEPSTQSPTFEPTEEPTLAQVDYQEWLDTRVTKADGVMFEVIEQIPHDSRAFTQGLTFDDGVLYESTGNYGSSTVRTLDPVTGTVLSLTRLPNQYFGEGIVFSEGRLIQLTWREKTGFVYNASDLTIPPQSFQYKTTKFDEGWGITLNHIRNEFIVSDGSNNLIFWDIRTFTILRTRPVFRQSGSPARNLNELEFWRGRVIANVWTEDVILVIHPETGVVEKEYDFSLLWPRNERPSGTNVLNGISISEDPDVLFVTGKFWNRMYKLRLLP